MTFKPGDAVWEKSAGGRWERCRVRREFGEYVETVADGWCCEQRTILKASKLRKRDPALNGADKPEVAAAR